MAHKFSRICMALTTAFVLTMSAAGHAKLVEETPSAMAMTGDALIARPALLVATIAGGAVFLVSLPFSALGGNVDEAVDVLVKGPAKATFVRCLGCTISGKKVSQVVTQ
jgi:hypothetical protein